MNLSDTAWYYCRAAERLLLESSGFATWQGCVSFGDFWRQLPGHRACSSYSACRCAVPPRLKATAPTPVRAYRYSQSLLNESARIGTPCTSLHMRLEMAQSSSCVTRLVPVGEVLNRLGISKPTLYRGIKAGILPAPVHISARRVGWRSMDIDRLTAGDGVVR